MASSPAPSLDARASGLDRGHAEGPPPEPLVPQGVAVAVPVQDLDAIASLGSEDEEVAARRVEAGHLPGQLGEAIEATPHVDGGHGQPDPRRRAIELGEGRERDQARPSAAACTAAMA
jgi:hypothetical protein